MNPVGGDGAGAGGGSGQAVPVVVAVTTAVVVDCLSTDTVLITSLGQRVGAAAARAAMQTTKDRLSKKN